MSFSRSWMSHNIAGIDLNTFQKECIKREKEIKEDIPDYNSLVSYTANLETEKFFKEKGNEI